MDFDNPTKTLRFFYRLAAIGIILLILSLPVVMVSSLFISEQALKLVKLASVLTGLTLCMPVFFYWGWFLVGQDLFRVAFGKDKESV